MLCGEGKVQIHSKVVFFTEPLVLASKLIFTGSCSVVNRVITRVLFIFIVC